ncbi:DNA-binding transcriptional LysR family regulator [Orbus hercynius]|uniref:DNA-binding transcriptional LysR family regulator n=1 Tax=Orbus hercynius TaxID=593135 RepID=A0A495RJZ5_9GAMM|nr:LysR family transcriptional regulator [Orbus hercynius]RKS87651.1 DNA-binding transcriptional LysR family regulator [Orbus hercynius]
MDKSNKLLEMSIFITIVDEGSLVGAAIKLKLSKQAVSRYLTSLEERLRVRLLQRTTRTIALTYEGQNFYLQAKSIIASVTEAEAMMHAELVDPVGLLRINVPVSFGILILAPLWQQFRNKYPNVVLDITLSDRVVNLLEEGYDLAVRIGQLENSSLVARKLTSTRIIAAASPGYLYKYGQPTHPHELQNHDIILYSHWAKNEVWQFEQNKALYPVQLRAKVYCNNGDTCRMLMLQDGGISLQPDFIIGEDLKQGHLVDVLPDYKVSDYNVYAVYPSRKLVPLRTQCLIDFLLEKLQQ